MEAALLTKLAETGSGDFAQEARLVNCSGTAMTPPRRAQAVQVPAPPRLAARHGTFSAKNKGRCV